MSALRRGPGLAPADKADLLFSLGRLLDAAGNFNEAYATYFAANAFSRQAGRAPPYDWTGHQRLVDQLIAASPATESPPPISGARPPPVFICGMFRSGSTLVDQVLASHSRVTSGGELTLLPALVRRELSPWPAALASVVGPNRDRLAGAYLADLARLFPGADVITDKRPDNFLHIGLIKRLFPDARIVNTVPNPLDNILSVYFLHLDHSMAYALSVEDTAHYLVQERRLMAHWKTLWPNDILDFDYDAFVQHPRPQTERLLAFCRLDWDDACLAFHQADSNVRTASVWQVGEPLYKRASGRWRRYASQLEPVRVWLEEQGLL